MSSMLSLYNLINAPLRTQGRKVIKMNDLISNFADEVRQYILDVLSGKKKTEDKCLDNYAKAARKYVELTNKSEGEATEEELNQIEKYLEDATLHINCGFGEIIDNAISQLKAEVEELRISIKQKK